MSSTWILRISLIVFGLLMGLGASEVALRIIEKRNHGSEFQSLTDLRRSILSGEGMINEGGQNGHSMNLAGIIYPNPDDNIIYDLRPELNVTFQGVPVRTSKCGLRNRETPLVKPAGTYRIAFIGDSFAFGWGVKQEQSFAQVLENTLNGISKGRPNFEVLNFGVPGYSTFQEVARFKETGLDFDPDAVIVYFVENDFGLPFYIRDIQDKGRLLSSLDLARVASRAMGPSDDQKFKQTAYDPSRALMELSDVAAERGIKIYLAINPKKAWNGIRSRLWALKERRDIFVMDLFNDLVSVIQRENIPEDTLQLANDPHPSAVKHKILGEIMAPYFLPVIDAASH